MIHHHIQGLLSMRCMNRIISIYCLWGSSHCYRTFIPEILDKKLGVNTFNVGTSAQQMDGSFMVIKEAAKYNNIKHIYLEVYYNLAFNAKKIEI